ncbi:fluoride efflux transporter CrcB [Thermogemmatispora tikiterensis]|uniref:Fluoride-specific ion channel FluC n=1 Tax=Thermogemmatispora tikiterensis TaxID=1825093 RepID=A0A328VLU7_9CHLR|nr:fluoride efflux transporter CrcB [Thermogemmatispora tikiterensis]RAQ97831.1 hypothetical protein A4R35_19985 [Thermogemmatispora tikiterensis]
MAQVLSRRRRLGAVMLGGFCGTLARAWLSPLLQAWFGKSWPYDILLINLSGALALALATVLAEATFLIGPTRRLLITVGFLGAYTTFSSLALGDILLLSAGRWLAAVFYLLLSLGGGIVAIWLGTWLGERCLSVRRWWHQRQPRARPSTGQPSAAGQLQPRSPASRAATEQATLSSRVEARPGQRDKSS